MKWYFQEVHHGLWDYDNPASPVLGTVTVNRVKVDFVAQVVAFAPGGGTESAR
jgi:quinoprotein glucose dehydrogenase